MAPGVKTATANARAVKVNDATLRVLQRGQGPPLFVQPPGWGISAAPYEETFGELERRFTITYHDPRGSGGSTRGPKDRALSVAGFVNDLEALRRESGNDSIALLGHSHGGLIALHYAIRYPQHLSRLILVDAQLVGVQAAADLRPVFAALMKDERFAEAYRKFSARGGFGALGGMRSDAELSAFMKDVAPIYLHRTEYADLLARIFETSKPPLATCLAVSMTDGQFPVMPAAKSVRVPTLLINGKYDILCPSAVAQAFAKHVPSARAIEIDNAGHFPWIEQDSAFIKAIDDFSP